MFASRLSVLRVASAASIRQTKNQGGQSSLTSRFSSSLPLVRKEISSQERASLRAARRERAAQLLQQQQQKEAGDAAVSSAGSMATKRFLASRWIWYAAVGVPSALLVWGFSDENSPPAKLSEMIGLTGMIRNYTDEIAKPSHDKLLPDWSQVRIKAVGADKHACHLPQDSRMPFWSILIQRCPMCLTIYRPRIL